MKLYNTIIVYDVYAVAESPEAAMEAVITFIRDQQEPLETSQQTAFETRDEKGVRTAWIDKRPLVGADISDEDFETLKGKTTIDVHAMIYKKQQTLPGTK